MIEEMPLQGSAIPNIKKLINDEFTVSKYICSIEDCDRKVSPSDNDLCRKHETEIADAAELWQQTKLERYEDMIDRRIDEDKL